MMKLLAAAVIGLLAMPAAAGPCRRVLGLDPEILTPANATIDQLGGILVIAAESLRADAPFTDMSVQPYDFRGGGHTTRAKVTALAPGLALYRPDGRAAEVDLLDAPNHAALHVTYRPIPVRDAPAAPAPVVTAISYTTNVPRFRTEQTVATLAAAPPPGTVAIVVYDAKDRPRSYALIDDPTRTSFEVYFRDRCKAEVPGTTPTRGGDKVTLAWVDATGHRSVRSAVTTVGTP